MTEFERGIACAIRTQPGRHGVLPPGAQQLLREAATKGSHGSPERKAAVDRANAEIRTRWPGLFRDD